MPQIPAQIKKYIVVEETSTNRDKPEKLTQINTVLVIDDDDNWCFLSKKILQKAGVGKKIITASNGQEGINKLQALAKAGETLPDIIFLDIKMPVMDGFEFLEELSKTTGLNLSQTKIFMCTSSFHPKDRERANIYPIAGFLTKPLTAEGLGEILQA